MPKPAGKSIAITAYITFVGLLIAYFLNKDDKHPFATWHIKNMFGLQIILFCSLVMPHQLIGAIIYWTAVICWLWSLIMVLSNKQQGVPFLSEKFQTWFTFLD